jgi:hypothetical protein
VNESWNGPLEEGDHAQTKQQRQDADTDDPATGDNADDRKPARLSGTPHDHAALP